jgi:hypothetical protein
VKKECGQCEIESIWREWTTSHRAEVHRIPPYLILSMLLNSAQWPCQVRQSFLTRLQPLPIVEKNLYPNCAVSHHILGKKI